MYGDHGPARKAQRKKKNTEMFKKNLKNLGKLSDWRPSASFYFPSRIFSMLFVFVYTEN